METIPPGLTAEAQAVRAREDRGRAAERLATCASRFNNALRDERLRHARVRLGVLGPPWITALITGSIAAFAFAGVAMWVATPGPLVLFWCILLGYLFVGGASFGVMRDAPGETDQNRLIRRRELLTQAVAARVKAEAGQAAAVAELTAADTLLADAERAATSKRDALLTVEPGRLYPDELERFVGAVFEHLGYWVRLTGKSGDQGVDVLAERPGLRVAVQVKCYSSAVGNSAVQEAFAGAAHYKCDKCVVVTNNYFTASAKSLAQSTGCLLIDRDLIEPLICGEIL